MKLLNPIGSLFGVALASSTLLLQLVEPARAITWRWNYVADTLLAPNCGGSGTFTTTDTPVDGSYTITGITGTTRVPGIPNVISPITAPLPPDTFFGNDNLLAVAPPQLTASGVAFSTTAYPYNVIWFGEILGTWYYTYDNVLNGSLPDFLVNSFEATPSPEPSGIFGFIALGGAMVARSLTRGGE
jgi:hypothetical protein